MDKYSKKTNPQILLYGNGGHAKVVREAINCLGLATLAYFDDGAITYGQEHHNGYLGAYDVMVFPDTKLHVAIGDNLLRKMITDKVHHPLATVVHPESRISADVQIGEGCFIGLRSILQTETILGKGCIVNTACIIEHECQLGDFVHVAPGAILCGKVVVGAGSIIGAGARIKNHITIGRDVKIGIGSVVINDIPDGDTVAGIPAVKI